MKIFVLFLTIAFVAAVQAIEVPEEVRNEILEICKGCLKVSGLTKEEARKVHNYPDDGDDEKIRKHLVCIAEKAELIHADGTLNTEKIKDGFKKFKATDAEIDKILTECAVQKSTIEETVTHYTKCRKEVVGNLIHFTA